MIYLDLDGVFVDFHGGMSRHVPSWLTMSTDELWQAVGEIEHFFAKLPPFEEAFPLFNYLYDTYNCEVLTAMPRREGFLTTARRDKVEWVQKHLTGPVRHIQVHCVDSRRDKRHMCFEPHDVLIDDHPGNVELWTNAGGIGILHTSVEDTFKQIRELEDQHKLVNNIR